MLGFVLLVAIGAFGGLLHAIAIGVVLSLLCSVGMLLLLLLLLCGSGTVGLFVAGGISCFAISVWLLLLLF